MVLMVKASIYLGNITNIKNLCEGSIEVAYCEKKKTIELLRSTHNLLIWPLGNNNNNNRSILI